MHHINPETSGYIVFLDGKRRTLNPKGGHVILGLVVLGPSVREDTPVL